MVFVYTFFKNTFANFNTQEAMSTKLKHWRYYSIIWLNPFYSSTFHTLIYKIWIDIFWENKFDNEQSKL